jgi:predicted Zn-dependent peptidase
MAKLIITGDLKEQDIWLIAKFFREFWRYRDEKLFMLIEGVENMTKAEVEEIIKKVFTDDDKDWSMNKLNQKMIEEFKESLK